MSDAATVMRETTRPKASKAVPTFEGFEMPKFEMPAAIRGLLEKTGAEAKENYEKMKIATDRTTDVLATSYSSAVKGGTDYGLKVIDITRVNASAAFDLFGKLVAIKSPSEAIEISTAHARQQFDAVSTQSKEIWALAQKVATDMIEPIKTGMSKALQRNA
jgi:phasin